MSLDIRAWHVHTSSCTAESCGLDARYLCHGPREENDRCVKPGHEGTVCLGHSVPTKAELVIATLAEKAKYRGMYEEKIAANEADNRLRGQLIEFPKPTLEDLPS